MFCVLSVDNGMLESFFLKHPIYNRGDLTQDSMLVIYSRDFLTFEQLNNSMNPMYLVLLSQKGNSDFPSEVSLTPRKGHTCGSIIFWLLHSQFTIYMLKM